MCHGHCHNPLQIDSTIRFSTISAAQLCYLTFSTTAYTVIEVVALTTVGIMIASITDSHLVPYTLSCLVLV